MLAERFDSVDVVVVDVETTGLDPHLGDRVIEIGAVKFHGGVEIARFHSMVNPDRDIPPEASQINGITEDMVRDAAGADVVMASFAVFSADCLFAAYNAPFDLSFIESEMDATGVRSPNWTVIDVLALARHLLPELTSHRLEAVVRALGFVNNQAHRALGDAFVTARVMHTFLGQLKARDVFTIGELLELTQRPN